MRALFVFGSIALYVALAFVSPSEANIHALSKKVAELADTHASTLVDDVSNGLSAALPVATSAIETAETLLQNPESIASSISTIASSEASSVMRTQFERIQWAVGKGDPKLCKTLGESSLNEADSGKPTFGDLLAFCLAATTRELTRCEKISTVTAPALKDACIKGLDSEG